MATANKTTENQNSVSDFINTVPDEAKRADSVKIAAIFEAASGFQPKMWGTAIIGYGSYHYKYDSGREGDAPLTGFSPRKDAFALYISLFEGREKLLEKFGKHKTGKGCIYVKKIEDVNVDVLKEMIQKGIRHTQEIYPD